MGFEGFVSEFGSLKYIGLPRGKLQHACLFCHDNLRVSRQGWRVDGLCCRRAVSMTIVLISTKTMLEQKENNEFKP